MRPKVSAGRNAYPKFAIGSSKNGVHPLTGSHCSPMANMKISSTAAAKEGKEINPADTVDAIRSTTPPWFEPAIRASGIEMSNAIRIASTASSADTGNRCAIISDTDNDVRVGYPRSPCMADRTQLKYL